MSGVSGHFPRAQRQCLALQRTLETLESRVFDEKMHGDASSSCRELSNTVKYLEMLARQEAPARQQMWLGRIGALAENCETIGRALRAMEAEHQKRFRSQQMRSALLGNDPGQRERFNAYQTLQQNQDSLQSSNSQAEQMLQQGQATLDQLKSQGSLLKGAHRRLLDVANTLGLSKSLIRMIERRDNVDRWLVIGGMLLSTLVLFLLYYYFVRK